MTIEIVLVLLLVLVLEKDPLRCHAGRNRTVAARSGRLLGADGQQIDHEHEQEHEHDSLNFGIWVNGQDDASRRGSGGRRRSADAELWRPCEPDVARGNRGGVGSLALPPTRPTVIRWARCSGRADLPSARAL
jgi:hypothetical protein